MKFGNHVRIEHNKTSRMVTIEMTEDVVVGCYLSGCAMLIGGLIAGCTVWQKKHKPSEPCACASCQGLYRNARSLGKGGYGEAMLAMRQGKPYVVKRVGCDTINAANTALREASLLQKLDHPNVVKFEDVFLHRHDNGGCSVAIVMEFCAGGDLIDRLECTRSERPLSELQTIVFLESLCHALHHVHCNGVLHRDLKSSNIFVSRGDKAVKLGDFGLACSGLPRRRLTGSPRRMSRCGTAMYMSPEVAECKPYGAASDTYGLGCVLLEMLLRHQLRERRPFEERKDYIREALAAAQGHGWHSFERVAELVWRMLDEFPKSRIELPAAAAAAAAAASILARQQAAGGEIASRASTAAPNGQGGGAGSKPSMADASAQSSAVTERTRPAKRVVAEERSTRRGCNGSAAVGTEGSHSRRRRLLYAD